MGELNRRLAYEVGVEVFYRSFLPDLDPRGGRLWARCPFHEDRDPSFAVFDLEKGLWKCFSNPECGAGDMVSFYAKQKGLAAEGTAFAETAKAIEKDFLNGSRPHAPPPRKDPGPKPEKKATEDELSRWERYATSYLRGWPEAEGYPKEYGVRYYRKGAPDAGLLLPVHHAPSGRVVSVKTRYLREQPPAGRRKHPLKSENMHPFCEACGRAAFGSCFKEHEDQVVKFPGGLIGWAALRAHPESTALLLEGEKDMLAAARRLLPALFVPASFSAGAASSPEGAVAFLKDYRTLVAYDADPAGRGGATKVLGRLLAAGGQAGRADLLLAPGGHVTGADDAKDLADYFDRGGSPDDLTAWLSSIPMDRGPPEEPEGGNGDAKDGGGQGGGDDSGRVYHCSRFDDQRPLVRLTTNLDLVVEASEDVLVKADAPVFKRGNSLVRICRNHRPAKKERLTRAADAPYIDRLEAESLVELLSSAARYERYSKTEEDWVPAEAPEKVARLLAARSDWRFRHLEAIVEGPFLRPSGEVVEKPGYDAATGIILEPNARFDRVPAKPTRDDAMKALSLLTRPFEEFTFVHDYDLAATLSAVLTVAGRSAIEGCVPGYAISAPTPGSGKTLIVDLVSAICLGHKPAVTPWPAEEAEWDKLITSLGRGGDALVNVDNIEGVVSSESLASALTGLEKKVRLFHAQRTLVVPLRMVWFLTGNNIAFQGDLYRRILQVEIDPGTEDPEARVFKHQDILLETAAARPALLPAALTVLRAYHLAGRPRPQGFAPKGSFEAWDSLVRGAVLWLTGLDPCLSSEKLKKDANPELRRLRTLLACWLEAAGEEPITIAALIGLAETTAPMMAPLREALIAFGKDATRLPGAHALGNKFNKFRGRIFDGIRLDCGEETRNKVSRWYVKRVLRKS